ncbi:MAG: PKD domain-containing protein [Methanomicrobiales archaeon]|nr:PKD domain-containing protein [Methanomicrobiales archaeon]
MVDGGKLVRTVMDPIHYRYHVVLIIILISLIVAVGITVFLTGEQGPVNVTPGSGFSNKPLDLTSEPDITGSYIIRILWYDDQNRTYSFHDYPSSTLPDPGVYQYSGDPPVHGAKMAMIRFLTWDGSTERTLDARYILDQEMVTSILNRYSLTPSMGKEVRISPSVTRTPEPEGTPEYGMLIPKAGIVCRNPDGSYSASFGYQSRHDHPVVLQVGDLNRFVPGEKDRGQPVVFLPGIHNDAFSITYPSNVTNQVWELMNIPVSAGTVPGVNTSIFIEPVNGYAPLEVWLHERSTGGTVSNPLVGIWDLGDGTTSEKTGSFTHRYETPGMYSVSYSVKNRCSQASDSDIVTVYSASYSWTPADDNPAHIQFQDKSDGSPDVWFWDFGDGYTSWEQHPSHEYTHPGTYQVGLTVSGKHGKGVVVRTVEIDAKNYPDKR